MTNLEQRFNNVLHKDVDRNYESNESINRTMKYNLFFEIKDIRKELLRKLNKKVTSNKINKEHTLELINYFNKVVLEYNKIQEVRVCKNLKNQTVSFIEVKDSKSYQNITIPKDLTKKSCKQLINELKDY